MSRATTKYSYLIVVVLWLGELDLIRLHGPRSSTCRSIRERGVDYFPKMENRSQSLRRIGHDSHEQHWLQGLSQDVGYVGAWKFVDGTWTGIALFGCWPILGPHGHVSESTIRRDEICLVSTYQISTSIPELSTNRRSCRRKHCSAQDRRRLENAGTEVSVAIFRMPQY